MRAYFYWWCSAVNDVPAYAVVMPGVFVLEYNTATERFVKTSEEEILEEMSHFLYNSRGTLRKKGVRRVSMRRNEELAGIMSFLSRHISFTGREKEAEEKVNALIDTIDEGHRLYYWNEQEGSRRMRYVLNPRGFVLACDDDGNLSHSIDPNTVEDLTACVYKRRIKKNPLLVLNVFGTGDFVDAIISFNRVPSEADTKRHGEAIFSRIEEMIQDEV